MPTLDLYLPPRTHSAWRAKRHIHPVAAAWMLISSWVERSRQRQALGALEDALRRPLYEPRSDPGLAAERSP